jgi:hypothetical protein
MATTAAKNRNNLDEVYELEDQALGAWYPNRAANIMFGVAQYPNEELVRDGSGKYGEGMGPEFYDWAYRGKKTYEAIDNPDLFVPSEYEWSMEEGEPDSDGQAYNGGSIDDRFDNVGVFQIFPDTGQYIQERFREFMNA